MTLSVIREGLKREPRLVRYKLTYRHRMNGMHLALHGQSVKIVGLYGQGRTGVKNLFVVCAKKLILLRYLKRLLRLLKWVGM